MVEMICVMAVLVGLVILSFPSLRGVLVRSQDVRCVSNLRQIGIAVQSYASEHNSDLPPSESEDSEWFNLNSKSWLREYGGGNSEERAKKLLRCPGDLTRAPVTDYKYYYSYAVNADLLLVYENGSPKKNSRPTKLHAVTRMILFADGVSNAENPGLVRKYPTILTSKTAATRVSSRHREGANCLFGDGSVQWLALKDAIEPTLYKSTME